MPKQRQIWALAGWLGLAYPALAVGALATVQAGSFYAELTRPAWSPPSWLFGPVWTVLYGLMGIAAWLFWRETEAYRRTGALSVFGLQLVVNALWSWLFFGWQLGGWAFVDILFLWTLIALNIALFWRTKPLAGALLIPCVLWVTFAAALNFSIWQMNPQVL